MQRPGYTRVAAVTPSDTVDVAPGFTVKAIYVGVAGDLNVLLTGESAAKLLLNVPLGFHPLAVQRVFVTNTAATDMFVLGD